jgi:prepilin-type N-terminal cleavage/methylation domain-containing protein
MKKSVLQATPYKLQTNKGYTLVELLVTVSIFALAFLAIGAIFLGFSTAQSRAGNAQRLLNEGNFLFESVAREIRMRAIDYDCLEAANYESETDYVCLKSIDGAKVHFQVIDQTGSDYDIQICRDFTGSACTTWRSIKPSFLTVTKAEFYISPVNNPLDSNDFNEIFHPLTLITMTIETGSGRTVKKHNFQTTVSSRLYNF